jgi:hypothetical protein
MKFERRIKKRKGKKTAERRRILPKRADLANLIIKNYYIEQYIIVL